MKDMLRFTFILALLFEIVRIFGSLVRFGECSYGGGKEVGNPNQEINGMNAFWHSPGMNDV